MNQNNRIFKDKNGKVVITQTPNVPLVVWLVCLILSKLVDNAQLAGSLSQVGRGFLFIWAYLEIVYGVNLFRRVLGVIVLGLLIFNTFNR